MKAVPVARVVYGDRLLVTQAVLMPAPANV
jgi:hypothetical protein